MVSESGFEGDLGIKGRRARDSEIQENVSGIFECPRPPSCFSLHTQTRFLDASDRNLVQ